MNQLAFLQQRITFKQQLYYESIRLSQTINDFLYLTPNGRVTGIVNMARVFVISYNILTVGYRIGFEKITPKIVLIIDCAIDFLYVLTLIARLFFAQESGNEIIKSRGKAFINLTNPVKLNSFFFTLIVLIPFDWFSDNPYFRLNKMLLATELFDAMDSLESFFSAFSTIYRMVKQIIYILLLIHIFACILFSFSNNNIYYARHGNLLLPAEPGDPNILLVQTMLQSGPGDPSYSIFKVRQYLASFFLSTVYLVGYATTIPQDSWQALFAMATVIISAVFFATIVGTVGALVRNIGKTKDEYMAKMDQIKSYMEFRKISKGIRRDIRTFYRTLYETKRGEDQNEVVEELYISIKRDLAKFLHRELVSKVPLFKECGEMFVEDVCIHLQYTLLLKGYYIVRKGEIGKEMFFIGSGVVEVVSEDEKPVVYARLGTGQFFGEIALFSAEGRRTASIRAGETCEMYVLYKRDFDELLEKYSEAKMAVQRHIEARVADLQKKKKQEEEAKKKKEEEEEAKKKEESEKLLKHTSTFRKKNKNEK